MVVGPLDLVGVAYPLIVPVWVTTPIFAVDWSTNHTEPSGPTVMSAGPLCAVTIGNSVIIREAADADPATVTTRPAATSAARVAIPLRRLTLCP
jgi:hypothetical protein